MGEIRPYLHLLVGPILVVVLIIWRKRNQNWHPPLQSDSVPQSKWFKALKALWIAWILIVGQMAYYYGNLPIWGSTVPTPEQPVAISIKGNVRYISEALNFRVQLSKTLFFATWGLGVAMFAVYRAKQLYWDKKEQGTINDI